MEWKWSEDQESLRKLAAKAFAERSAPSGAATQHSPARSGWREPWAELGRAGLLDLAIPTEHGGAGLGLVELCLVLEQAGRAAANVPLIPSLVAGALTVAAFGTEEQRGRILPRVARGEAVLGAALVEAGIEDPIHTRARAVRDGAGFRLDGVKSMVEVAGDALFLLVPAALDGSVALFLVDPRAAGLTFADQSGTDDEPISEVTLSSVRVGAGELLGGGEGTKRGAEIVAWMMARVGAGLCAMELGVASRQLEMISEYVMKRQQFGKPIGLFQAVAQRAADAYVDVEAMRLATWQAVWRLAEGLPAERELLVAQLYAAEAGQRVALSAQHLHGGMGFDRGHPLHRYFLLARKIELALGGAHRQLARLGARIAEAAKTTL